MFTHKYQTNKYDSRLNISITTRVAGANTKDLQFSTQEIMLIITQSTSKKMKKYQLM